MQDHTPIVLSSSRTLFTPSPTHPSPRLTSTTHAPGAPMGVHRRTGDCAVAAAAEAYRFVSFSLSKFLHTVKPIRTLSVCSDEEDLG
jgi:hypothetical protein